MKILPVAISGLLLAVGPVTSAKEKIFSSDALDSEKGFRHVIESCFPELEFGCFYSAGGILFAVLEDFDRHRVMLIPANANGETTVTRNGKNVDLPLKEEFKVKLAGATSTAKGRVDIPEQPLDFRIGWWLPLEATDRLSIKIEMEYPATGSFQVTYGPDARWEIASNLKNSKPVRPEPVDAYEITRRSLHKKVIDVLQKQDACRVGMRGGMTLRLEKEDPQPEAEFEPLRVRIGADKIAVGPPDSPTFLTSPELIHHVTAYQGAARSAGVEPRVTIQTTPDSSDTLFRELLGVLADYAGLRFAALDHKVSD